MKHRRFTLIQLIQSILYLTLFCAVLFADFVRTLISPQWLQSAVRDIQTTCRNVETQWLVVVCLVAYTVVFLFLESKPVKNPTIPIAKRHDRNQKSVVKSWSSRFAFLAAFYGKIAEPAFWMACFLIIVLLRYVFNYATAAQSPQVVVLLAGIALGKGVMLYSGSSRRLAILFVLTLLLAVSAMLQPELGPEFKYRGVQRWSGLWNNPNIYGLLMGAGLVIAMGLLVQTLKSQAQCKMDRVIAQRAETTDRNLRPSILRAVFALKLILLIGSIVLCGFGLLKSFSRGAWCGTAIGIGSLIWGLFSPKPHRLHANQDRKCVNAFSCLSSIQRFRSNLFPLSIILIASLTISFWELRHTEAPLLRRLFSVGNVNDFSWRNRVMAWQGAGHMMLDEPWFGSGWGKAEEVFRERYKPVGMEDSAAVQMNDYLMLGISAGVPALVCLLVYLLLVLRGAECGMRSGNFPRPPAAAGATVLLVSFWFDGGLFKLPTSAVFWVLVESLRSRNQENKTQTQSDKSEEFSLSQPGDVTAKSPKRAKSQIVLHSLAGMAAFVAAVITGLNLSTPQLAVSDLSLSVARHFLVPPPEKNDFEYLAAKPIWTGKLLKTLLQHAHLANYNRALVNWKLDDQIYREFVLSPEIDLAWDGQMHWRRSLWEHFYPRMRKETSLRAAAEIVVRHLREQVKMAEAVDSEKTIREAWQNGLASERGFEAIYVAALRATGIPSQLSASGKAELWNGTEWIVAPRPAK